MSFLTVSEVARQLADRFPHLRPRDISDLFYQRRLEDRRCPVVGGRRLIPRDYLPTIEEALETCGQRGEPTHAS